MKDRNFNMSSSNGREEFDKYSDYDSGYSKFEKMKSGKSKQFKPHNADKTGKKKWKPRQNAGHSDNDGF